MDGKKEYIERGALIDSFENCYWLYNSTDRETVRQALENAPVADVAPVVHGEWKIEWDAEKDPKKYFVRIVCSNCGLKTGQKSNFCPMCGADMRKKVEV